MSAVEACVFVGDDGVGHGAACAGGEDGVFVAEGFGADGEGAEFHFFGPFAVDDEVGEFVVAGSCCFVAFEFGGYFGEGVVDVGGVDLG